MDICANNWYSRPKYSELACLWNPSSLPIAGSSVTIHVTETQNHGKVPVFGSFMVIFVDCNEIGCNICKYASAVVGDIIIPSCLKVTSIWIASPFDKNSSDVESGCIQDLGENELLPNSNPVTEKSTFALFFWDVSLE